MSSSKVLPHADDFTPVSLVADSLDESTKVFTPTSPVRVPGENRFVPGETMPAESGEEPFRSPAPPEPDEPDREAEVASPETNESAPPPTPEIDIETLRQEAYEQGRNDARRDLEGELLATVAGFKEACQRLEELRNRLLGQHREEIINLAIALADHIIGHEPTIQRDLVVKTLEKALDAALKEESYEVWLNPDDLEQARQAAPELIRSLQHLTTLNFRTDTTIRRGGCRVEGESCLVDATLQAQLESARQFLLDRLQDQSGPADPDHPVTEPGNHDSR